MAISIKNNTNEITSIPTDFEEYLSNKFVKESIPQKEENHKDIKFWVNLINSSKEQGVFRLLKNCYPQLNFPIKQGIDSSEAYKNATLKGQIKIDCNNAIGLNQPHKIDLYIHESIAGKIPVLVIYDNADFKKVIQALYHKNNPVNIPDSMGASFANGLNNWDRLNELKLRWIEKNPLGNWSQEFVNNIKPHPSKFKDQLIILSNKFYSNVQANALQLNDDEWRSQSLKIRLEHECTHLYTLQKFGVMSNNLHDELIADYIGICKSAGYFNKNWMLHFMGLENYPNYRKGARLENYLRDLNNSQESFELITTIVKNAIDNLSDFDNKLGAIKSDMKTKRRIETLCKTSLIDIASENGVQFLLQKYRK